MIRFIMENGANGVEVIVSGKLAAVLPRWVCTVKRYSPGTTRKPPDSGAAPAGTTHRAISSAPNDSSNFRVADGATDFAFSKATSHLFGQWSAAESTAVGATRCTNKSTGRLLGRRPMLRTVTVAFTLPMLRAETARTVPDQASLGVDQAVYDAALRRFRADAARHASNARRLRDLQATQMRLDGQKGRR